jgi:hypothetical protein
MIGRFPPAIAKILIAQAFLIAGHVSSLTNQMDALQGMYLRSGLWNGSK